MSYNPEEYARILKNLFDPDEFLTIWNNKTNTYQIEIHPGTSVTIPEYWEFVRLSKILASGEYCLSSISSTKLYELWCNGRRSATPYENLKYVHKRAWGLIQDKLNSLGYILDYAQYHKNLTTKAHDCYSKQDTGNKIFKPDQKEYK